MSRPLRIEFAGALHHVMARGNARGVTFRDDDDREAFLAELSRVCERFERRRGHPERRDESGRTLEVKFLYSERVSSPLRHRVMGRSR